MIYHYDEDEWETVVSMASGNVVMSQRRRDPAEIVRIKAERTRKEEDEILRRAEAIMARRRATPPESEVK